MVSFVKRKQKSIDVVFFDDFLSLFYVRFYKNDN